MSSAWCALVLLLADMVAAYPSGADPQACMDMIPQHGYVGQTSPSPYTVSTSASSYRPNKTLKVTIISVGQSYFEGFLIQARRISAHLDTTVPVGSFSQANGTHTMCTDPSTGWGALTHSDASQKTNLTLTWNAPASAQGDLAFFVTLVKAADTYWIRQNLANVSGMAPVLSTTTPGTTIPTTTMAPESVNVSTASCGQDKSCIYSPSKCAGDDSSCDFILTWKRIPVAGVNVAVRFEMQAKSTGYIAVGFSNSTTMDQDSIVACVLTDNGVTVRQLFSTDFGPPQSVPEPSNIMNAMVQASSGMISCSFVWNNDATARMSAQQFNLSRPYNVILAKGPAERNSEGDIYKHDVRPLVSSSALVMTSDKYTVNGAQPNRTSWLLKIHGSLMLVAWMLCCSTSIILARYYKKMWLDRKHCGEKVWFTWHRIGLIITVIFTIAAVTVVFVHVGGWSPSRGLPLDAHPFIGIVATGFCVINPIMAAFRCNPGSKNRYLFNWAHWFIGTAALVLAGAAILIGLQFDGMAPSWLLYLAAAYVAFFLLTYFVLWLHDLVVARSGENMPLSHFETSMPLKDDGCCVSFKCFAFSTFLAVTLGTTATVVYFILSQDIADSSSS